MRKELVPSPLGVGGHGDRSMLRRGCQCLTMVVVLMVWQVRHKEPKGSLMKGSSMATTIKAFGEWCILSGSKKDGDAVYGARIWEGQTVKAGDLVVLVNWKSHESMTVLGEKGETVKGNPQRGKVGYSKWSVVTNK